MFKLLHSKMFRQNLCKWVFMYIAAIGLLTSVITYSKYISNFIRDPEQARSAKFNVDISPMMISCTENSSGNKICPLVDATNDFCNQPTPDDKNVTSENKSYICPVTSYRPTKPIEFYFKIDFSEMEVSSDIFIRVEELNEYLKIQKISLVDKTNKNNITAIPGPLEHNGTVEYQQENIVHFDGKKTNDTNVEIPVSKNNLIHIGVDVSDKNRITEYYFKIEAEYEFKNSDKVDNDIVFNDEELSDTIRVGFSAIQRDK